MDTFKKLTEHFHALPGVGPRQAKRFAYFLLQKPSAWRKHFAHIIEQVGTSMRECTSCARYFETRKNSEVCDICAKARDPQTLLIVERDSDLDVIEQSHLYNGNYFVLGGTIPLLESEPTKRIKVNHLLEIIGKKIEEGLLREIIFALSLTPQGEHTRLYLTDALLPLATKHKIILSTLGRGISTGAEVEYLDQETMKNALTNRLQ